MNYSVDELKDIYERKYDRISRAGSQREQVIYSKYRDLLIDKSALPEKRDVLDLGCGTGFKTVGFHREGDHTLAVDLSENVIRFCNSVHKVEDIKFIAGDAYAVEGTYDLITAFGFSLFNTADNDEFVKNVSYFFKKYLSPNNGSAMLIGSFTDFSGSGEASWYMHSEQDLQYIKERIESVLPVSIEIVFPHRKMANYTSAGVLNFLAECRKLILNKRRNFFIKIIHQ